jgi:cytochrome c oxidase assembly protein subunit 15
LAGEVLIAQIHGCVGPVFFAFTIALAVITSQRWQIAHSLDSPGMARLERLALIITFLAFLQIFLGSQLRHLPAGARPGEFRAVLYFHLVVAVALVAHIVMLAVRARRTCLSESWIMRPVTGLCFALGAQVFLGLGTWVTKYGFPAWLTGFDFAAGFRPTADAPWQMSIVTAHVAIGSMILGTSLLIALRSRRLVAPRQTNPIGSTPLRRDNGSHLLMEAAR